MISMLPIYRSDCRYFRGDIPCLPHKEHGVHCAECTHFEQQDGWILIIKLGALGDVIRTTPLLHKLRLEYPTKGIVWLTYYPGIVPSSVDRTMMASQESLAILQAMNFDLVINLDKDLYACALASQLRADEKVGFVLEDGKPSPADTRASHKFITGLYDDVNQSNVKSYVEEIFEICGYIFSGEEYILDNTISKYQSVARGKAVVGLNTGCGDRWTSRLWGDNQWEMLIRNLQESGVTPLLLGGELEHERNTALAATTGARYDGCFPLQEFISVVDGCDVIVTAVTMALHVAIGRKKPVVLMNNIFNPNEFELYGRGEIIQPSRPCTCFFRSTCVNNEYQCMNFITPVEVHDAVLRWIPNVMTRT